MRKGRRMRQRGDPIRVHLLVGGVAACAALSTSLRASERRPPLGQTAGALWGLATGVGSGGLMLYLRGRRHVIPCHWPCYAGFIPPCALAWWMSGRMEGDAADGGEEGGVVVRKKSFVASFATALLSGLSLVFYVSPDDGRP
eukprot:Tamp_29598.p2 GENE.Tamp_29598~~Tamp_29598.p2  ORF type:complete len:151 (+),score=18.56 Tamp_29598:30-455(+)